MRRTNWESFGKTAKQLQKNVKNTQQAGAFLADFPPDGYMRDNISKNLVVIKECKSSSLRRYISLLNNLYYIVPTEKDKEKILQKKIEIETELNSRGDEGIA